MENFCVESFYPFDIFRSKNHAKKVEEIGSASRKVSKMNFVEEKLLRNIINK